MYLVDRDLEFMVRTGQLIVDPAPDEYDTTSIDLRLDQIEEARIWDVKAFERQEQPLGVGPALLAPGRFAYRAFALAFAVPVPEETSGLVYRQERAIVVRPGGFFLWQTRERVGTPGVDPRLICFVNSRSTVARTALMVHMTAPTIHAGWAGKVTLEIANIGPFNLILHEFDRVAQLTVAAISSPPSRQKNTRSIQSNQKHVTGHAEPPAPPG